MSNWFVRSWKQQILLFTVTFAISSWFISMSGGLINLWGEPRNTQVNPPLNSEMCLEKISMPNIDPR